jgi:hypothetical protein
LRAVADRLDDEPMGSRELREWLLGQLPGPEDIEELGFGAWLRTSDRQTIVRCLDLRQMTVENQRLFCEAAKRARLIEQPEQWLCRCLAELADMVARYEGGEPPLSKSDWRDVIPLEGPRIGPGWNPV